MSAVKHDFQQFTVETTKYTKKSSSQHVDAVDQLDYAQKMRDKKNLPHCKIRFPTSVAFHAVWKLPKNVSSLRVKLEFDYVKKKLVSLEIF